MGSTKEIRMINFIMPHIFYISEYDDEYRTNFVTTLSNRIKNQLIPMQEDDASNVVHDQIVAVYYKSTLVRATVLCMENEIDLSQSYHCWLIDLGIVIKTGQLFKLPKDIQKITPICKQASLDNFCYLQTHLELGVTGKIVSKLSEVPPQNVTRKALDLLSNHKKIIFEEKGVHDGILTGEIIIHKNGKVLYLEKELIEAGIITKNNSSLFSNILDGSKKYLKTHLTLLYQCSSANKITFKESAKVNNVLLANTMKDLDNNDSFRTENGRRYRLSTPKSSSATSNSDANTSNSKTIETKPSCNNLEETPQKSPDNPRRLSNQELLLQKVKALREADAEAKRRSKPNRESLIKAIQYKRSASNKYEEGDTSSCDSVSVSSFQSGKNDSIEEEPSTPNDTMEVAAESRQENPSSLSYRSTQSVSGNECSDEQSSALISSTVESVSDCNVSTFAAITCQKSKRPRLPLAAAEANFNKNTKPKTTRKMVTSTRNGVPKVMATNDEDCPTIKIPDAADSLTDQDTNSISEKSDKTSSSESVKPVIFTKQDFCRLVTGCTCSTCRAAVEDDDWDAPIKFNVPEEEVKKPSKPKELIIKPPRLLKTESDIEEINGSQNEVLSIDYAGMTSMEKKQCNKVLVHGESIPVPIRQVSEVNIHRDIYNSISSLNYKQSKRIQQYAFPAITRNQHVIMVNDAKSGKTMAYLPILLSFIMEQKERYSKLLKTSGGPFVVILCSNSKRCEETFDLMKLILNKNYTKCALLTYPGSCNMNKVDILITMPAVMSKLISMRPGHFKRLCHLVLEDADIILKSHNDAVKKILNYADQVLEHRNCPKSIQLIMCCQHWTVQIENILLKLNQVPTVCIGNYLEAALYGKIKYSMRFIESKEKESSLYEVLHDKYKFTKSVVICNEDEVEGIQEFFTSKGIEYTSFLQVDKEEDILYVENAWNNVPAGKYLVLVCTDEIYNTINITSAQLLIHYSLPYSWSQFIKRFGCLLEHIQSPLDNNQRKHELSTHVFVEEHCEMRMSKFSNFVKISGIENYLPEKIKAYFMGVLQKEQQERVSRQIELCNTLKLFGKCDSLICKKRHILNEELDGISDILPKNGTIRFKIIRMTSAGSCSIKLLEHFDLNGESKCKYEDRTEEISAIIANVQHHRHTKLRISDTYLNKDENEYSRCRLLEIEGYALVYLIDRGAYKKTTIDRLFELPDGLKDIPPQAYEIHFANLIPPFDDERFSRNARQRAQFFVDSNCPNSTMTGTIMLQLGNNLWVDDVYEYVEMHDQSFPSIGFQLTRELVKESLAIRDQKQLQRLYDMCKEAKIELPAYKLAKPSVQKVVAQVQPNWAFLDLDDVQGVIFTSAVNPYEFYVRHNKFTSQLQQLEESILKEVCKPLYSQLPEVKVGKCCLVKDDVTEGYNRGLVLSLDDREAEVLCVDYGTIVYTHISTLKHISQEHILKLPFQSILCSLWGIKPIYDEWSSQATDCLYTIAFEQDQCTLRELAIKVNLEQENPFVQNQKSYKVTLATVKDGLPRLVNDLLINCGFAMPNDEEEIKLFELPEKADEDDYDDEKRKDDEIEQILREDDIQQLIEREIVDYEAFDLELVDDVNFFEDIDFPIKLNNNNNNNNNTKAIEEKKVSDTNLPPMKTVPAVDYYIPRANWSETDTHVKLKIHLCDVRKATFIVEYNRKFQFKTVKNGRKYQLDVILFAKVESVVEYKILGSEVRVLLKKLEATLWHMLCYTKDKSIKIPYDTSAINYDDDDEQKKRPILQLDMIDCSSGEDKDDTYYFVCSDQDSDLDCDIPSDD